MFFIAGSFVVFSCLANFDGLRSSRFQLSAYFCTLFLVRWVPGFKSFNLNDFISSPRLKSTIFSFWLGGWVLCSSSARGKTVLSSFHMEIHGKSYYFLMLMLMKMLMLMLYVFNCWFICCFFMLGNI